MDDHLKGLSSDPPETLAVRTLAVTLAHARFLCEAHLYAIDEVEHALERALIAAIGHRVLPADVAAFQRFHDRRFYAPAFRPRPFAYPVRRPDRTPEGVVSLHEDGEPIHTFVHRLPSHEPITFALNAATKVTLSASPPAALCEPAP